MAKGTVKFFNDGKGFGFITPDEGGKDVSAASIEPTQVAVIDELIFFLGVDERHQRLWHCMENRLHHLDDFRTKEGLTFGRGHLLGN